VARQRQNGIHTLDGRETQLLGNLGVLNLACIVKAHPPDQLGQIAAAGNGGSAAKGLELDVRDAVGLGVDTDLELHDIAASWCADEAGANIEVLLVHRADIAGAGVVVKDLLVIVALAARSSRLVQ
jgi:hypothetical protein